MNIHIVIGDYFEVFGHLGIDALAFRFRTGGCTGAGKDVGVDPGETGGFGIFIGGHKVFIYLAAGPASLLVSTDGDYVFGFLGALEESWGAELRYIDT